MKIQDQVCSPELARKLMGLGVNEKHKSHFRYSISVKEEGAYVLDFVKNLKYPFITERVYSLGELATASLVGSADCEAYTVAELGEILPRYVYSKRAYSERVEYFIGVIGGAVDLPKELKVRCLDDQMSQTEANARAKMLIYLIENKLIEL